MQKQRYHDEEIIAHSTLLNRQKKEQCKECGCQKQPSEGCSKCPACGDSDCG